MWYVLSEIAGGRADVGGEGFVVVVEMLLVLLLMLDPLVVFNFLNNIIMTVTNS